MVNSSGIPEQACHVSLAFTPDRLLLLASQGQHMFYQPLCPLCGTLSLPYHIRLCYLPNLQTSPADPVYITPGVFTYACHFLYYLHFESVLTWGTYAGVRSARLLSWQERLASLRDLLLWDHALWLGLRIYTVARPDLAQVCPLPSSLSPLLCWLSKPRLTFQCCAKRRVACCLNLCACLTWSVQRHAGFGMLGTWFV